MENKKLIIIGALCVVICVFGGAIFGMLTNSVSYERIEIAANGTTIEIPSENATYQGDINGTGVKLWTFKHGRLATFNSEEALSENGIYGFGGAIGFKDIKDLIMNHFEKQERVDDYIVYTIDANVINPDGKGKLYCIMMGNNDTHDNIVIVSDSKDITLHMAKSVQYKSSNTTNAANGNSNNANNANKNDNLIPIKEGDGSVSYFHVGDIVSRPNGYFRVNADGSLTKVADDPGNSPSSESSSSGGSSSSSEVIRGGQSDGASYQDARNGPSVDSDGNLVGGSGDVGVATYTG